MSNKVIIDGIDRDQIPYGSMLRHALETKDKEASDQSNDIEAADLQMHGGYYQTTPSRNDTIYPFTNENIKNYQHLFMNRHSMLAVIGSGEQIFNGILDGMSEIDAFDISRFAKYFLNLKIAAIKGLTKEEFIEMFYSKNYNIKEYINSDKIYQLYQNKIRNNLNGSVLEFWDYLFSKYTWYEICYHFYKEKILDTNAIIQNNKFLQGNNFDILKERIKKAKIDVKIGDILDLAGTYHKEYDLIYLSNIHTYITMIGIEYILKKLKLSKNGVILLGLVQKRLDSLNLDKLNEKSYNFENNGEYVTGIIK